jgi:hypothetical protein
VDWLVRDGRLGPCALLPLHPAVSLFKELFAVDGPFITSMRKGVNRKNIIDEKLFTKQGLSP